MATVYASDDLNHVVLTGRYLPTRESFTLSLPNGQHRLPAELAREDLTAILVISTVRRMLPDYRNSFGALAETYLPLDTWIIGPSEEPDALLNGWFADEPPDTDYRLLVMRSPRQLAGREVPPAPWTKALSRYASRMPQRKDKLSELFPITTLFLKEFLDAYRDGFDEVQQYLAYQGHRYCFFSG